MPVTRVPGPLRSARRPALGRLGPTVVAVLALLALPGTALAAEPLTMDARVLLEGHTRLGGWMAIEVRFRNDGPAVSGELRLVGGSGGRTRFGTAVDLPTGSAKRYLLYGQPPAFGRSLKVALVDGGRTLLERDVAFAVHDARQLVVGIVAERPQRIVAGLDLLPGPEGQEPVVVALTPDDLPERVEAWAPLDRLVWQDVDAATLSGEQLAALRDWVAAGGRLVLVGGTSGPDALAAIPDEILPYRPTTTVDVPPGALAALLGPLPTDASDVPALSGTLQRGRALARTGEAVVAAEAPIGAGSVTLVGFDPTVGWIAEARAAEPLWRRVLPPRDTATGFVDDSPIVGATSNLPSLALPPTGGLLALLAGYIVLIGPVNYLVLRRLDRREWAWLTMPLLVALFAVAAYGFGAALRGGDVILNEVAIVRAPADSTAGRAQVYLGVFSPTRASYDLTVRGGALLSPPIAGEFFGGGAAASSLDVLQGDPARVRDLDVGFSSLRTIRAEAPAAAPRVAIELRLAGRTLSGTVRNLSDETLERPSVVLGSSVAVLSDLPPGAERQVRLTLAANPFGPSLADRIVGQVFFDDPRAGRNQQALLIRRQILDQLSYDAMFGVATRLPADGPVLLAFGSRPILDVTVDGHETRRTSTVLYYIPASLDVAGEVTFGGDLLRATPIAADALFFNQDFGGGFTFGEGSVTLAYRPIGYVGALAPRRLLVGLSFGPDQLFGTRSAKPVQAEGPAREPGDEPSDCIGEACPAPNKPLVPGPAQPPVPRVDLFDLEARAWASLPELTPNEDYAILAPERYVDPASGTVLVRLVNGRADPVSVTLNVQLEGEVQ